MNKFTFPLEAVLIVRRSERSKAQIEYTEALRRHQAMLSSERDARNQIEKTMEKMAENRRQIFSVQSQNLDLDLLQNAFSNLRILNENLDRSEGILNKYLQKFLLSKQKEKLLRNLRKKRLEIFQKEKFKLDEKQIDELVISRRTANSLLL